MAAPKIPQNQIFAFPIQTLESAAAPGEITIIGNDMTRYWSSAALAMAFANVSTGSLAVSNPLDFRGISRLLLLVKRFFTVDRTDNITVGLTYNFSDGTAASNLDLFNVANGVQTFQQAGTNIALAAQNPMVLSYAFYAGMPINKSANGIPFGGVLLGTSGRLFCQNVQPVIGTDTFSFEAWAST